MNKPYSYALLDQNRMGSGLILDDSNLIVTTNAAGLDFDRTVCANMAKMNGDWYWEQWPYSDFKGDMTDGYVFGLLRLDSPMDSFEQYVGKNAYGFGYRLDLGAVYNNDTLVTGSDDFGPGSEEQNYGLFLHLSDPLNKYFVITRDGTEIAVIELPDDPYFWLPAWSLSSGNSAGDRKWEVEFGINAFENQPVPVV